MGEACLLKDDFVLISFFADLAHRDQRSSLDAVFSGIMGARSAAAGRGATPL
jgi:hypothetical protein